MIQQTKDKEWVDESGQTVPAKYIFANTRLKERSAAQLLKGAKSLNKRLIEFKKNINEVCQKVYENSMKEYNANPKGKGNFTWFNFDRSIKIEVSISDRIDFDDLAITASKEKLDQFLSESLDSKGEFVKDLVIDAFSTTHGKIDAKKVMQLMKYRAKITHPLFQEALNIISEGIRKPGSRTYFRIWERDEVNGKYNLVDLNFSGI